MEKQYTPMPEYKEWTEVRFIGRGSYGSVYEILRDEYGLKQNRALKVISIPQREEEIDEQFRNGMTEKQVTHYFESSTQTLMKELKLMDSLRNHPNIVSYEDHQVCPKKEEFGFYIMIRMELLTAMDVYYGEHPLTKYDVVHLGIDICSALEACVHEKICHRDLKPGNIFVGDNGVFKLGDFGIARTLDGGFSELSKKGTPNYMAPEVYRGQSYDYTVDTYSLGITMYKLLNGRLPFVPSNLDGITQKDYEHALNRRMQGEKLPLPMYDDGELAKIVLKACSFNPKDRYTNPTEMKAALLALNVDDNPEIWKSQVLPSEKAKPKPKPKPRPKPKPPEINKNITKVDKVVGGIEEEGSTVVEDEETIVEPEDETTATKKSRNKEQGSLAAFLGKHKGFVIASVILIIAIIGGVFGVQAATMTKIPDVSNLSEEEAVAAIENASLSPKKGESEISDDFAKDTVIRAEGTGDKVKKGTEVVYILSLGDETELFDMTGMHQTEAQALLEESGLKVTIKKDYSDDYSEGQVISQSEEKGTILHEGDSITLTISDGPEPITIESYVSKKYTDAKAALEALGFTVTTTTEYSDTVAKNVIISQNPEGGTALQPGNTITFVTSKGVEQVKVPSITGMTQKNAEAALKKAGLKAGKVSEDYSSSVAAGKVISQATAKDTSVDKGSSVGFTISLGEKPVESSSKSYSSSSNSSSYSDSSSYDDSSSYTSDDSDSDTVSDDSSTYTSDDSDSDIVPDESGSASSDDSSSDVIN